MVCWRKLGNVPQSDLKNIYHAIFASHLMYGAQVWTPKLLSITDKISRLQKNAMRIMTFSEFKAHSEPLFKQQEELLKFSDNIILSNCEIYLNHSWKSSTELLIHMATTLDKHELVCYLLRDITVLNMD